MAPKAWPRSAKNGRRCFAAFSARAPAAVSSPTPATRAAENRLRALLEGQVDIKHALGDDRVLGIEHGDEIAPRRAAAIVDRAALRAQRDRHRQRDGVFPINALGAEIGDPQGMRHRRRVAGAPRGENRRTMQIIDHVDGRARRLRTLGGTTRHHHRQGEGNQHPPPRRRQRGGDTRHLARRPFKRPAQRPAQRLWLPSHNGALPVTLQPQKNTLRPAGAL